MITITTSAVASSTYTTILPERKLWNPAHAHAITRKEDGLKWHLM